MKIFLILSILILGTLSAENTSPAKIAKLSKKGAKIADSLCKKELLPNSGATVDETLSLIENSGACPKLSKSKLEALAYYIRAGNTGKAKAKLVVPKDAKCPVCGMFVGKYPKWAAEMTVKGKKHYFDGVKDMMKFYIFDADFPYDRNEIGSMLVTDFYTLEAIPAKEAYYVIGSNVYGPMGNELVPFKSKKEAENFLADHKGEKILRFKDLDAKTVMALDGVEYEEQN